MERDDQATPLTEAIETEEDRLPDYEPPQVVTYRGQDILEALGPAHACSFNHSRPAAPRFL